MNTEVTRTLKTLTASVILAVGLLTTNLTNAAEVIFINLDKPVDTIHKTDAVKFKGDFDGLVEGKTYIVRITVIEDGGPDYGQMSKVFTVDW